jgi:hypothetical protein
MKQVIYLVLLTLFVSRLIMGQTTIYSDDFNGEDDKGQIGKSIDLTGVDWNITVNSVNFVNNEDFFAVQSGVFEAQDVGATAIWESEEFSISGYNNLQFSFDAKADGDFEASSDVFDVEIIIDGSNTTLFSATVDENVDGDPMVFGTTELSASLKSFSKDISQTGTNAKIKITIDNNAGAELIGFDNLSVTEEPILPEPTNYPNNFSATTNGYDQIDLSWNNNDGAQPAEGFLIVGKTGTGTYYSPSDGTEPSEDTDWSDNEFEVKISHGTQNYSVIGLNGATSYNFRVYPYTNSGSNIDFKTDGSIPTSSSTTNASPDLVINEILADPNGDANGDGTIDSNDDEFVELVNNSGSLLDISGWELHDSDGEKHTFSEDTEIPASESIVIFGGGTPTGIPGLTQTTTSLSLNNNGDEVIVKNPNGSLIVSHSYGTEASNSQSIARDPNLTGNFTKHTEIDDNPVQFSPGRDNTDNSALPVELTSFTASVKENIVNLSWQTETEVNNYGFEIERKSEEKAWAKIGFVEGYGNSNSPKNYSFRDDVITGSGIYFYRLKQLDNDGTFEYSQEISVIVGETEQFSLQQNYPNPFNPVTKITFSLPEKSAVKLTIYNALGSKVKELVNENMDAGFHEIQFDANELSSGIYFTRLQSKKFNKTIKMLLLR